MIGTFYLPVVEVCIRVINIHHKEKLLRENKFRFEAMRNLLIIFFLIVVTSVKAQQSFYIQYHPFPSQQAICLKESTGGGYLLGSNYTDSSGSKGILISRFDNSLNILW